MLNNTFQFFTLSIFPILKNIIVGTTIIIIGFIIARSINKLVYGTLDEIEINKLVRHTGYKLNAKKVLAKLTYLIISIITIITALKETGIATSLLNIILVASLVSIVILTLLWLKSYIPNAFAWFLIFRKADIKENDLIEIPKMRVKGKIVKIKLSETILKHQKDLFLIPNLSLYKSEIKKL